MKYNSENERMKKILSQGVYIEHDNDPDTMEFVPIMGDIIKFKAMNKKPSRMSYTFTYDQINQWLQDLHDLMKGKNIYKIDGKDLK